MDWVPDPVSDNSGEEDAVINRCPSCKKVMKSVLTHLQRSKFCKVDDQTLKSLQEKSIAINKQKQKDRYLKHQNKIKEMLDHEKWPNNKNIT